MLVIITNRLLGLSIVVLLLIDHPMNLCTIKNKRNIYECTYRCAFDSVFLIVILSDDWMTTVFAQGFVYIVIISNLLSSIAQLSWYLKHQSISLCSSLLHTLFDIIIMKPRCSYSFSLLCCHLKFFGMPFIIHWCCCCLVWNYAKHWNLNWYFSLGSSCEFISWSEFLVFNWHFCRDELKIITKDMRINICNVYGDYSVIYHL